MNTSDYLNDFLEFIRNKMHVDIQWKNQYLIDMYKMAHVKNQNHGKFKMPDGYKDVGYYFGVQPEIKEHYQKKHKSREFDNSIYQNRCSDVIHICDECKIVWHVDISD